MVGSRIALLLVLGAALLSACERSAPVRPRDGAPPVATGQTAGAASAFAPPPTLARPASGGDPPPSSGDAPPGEPSPTPSATPGFVIVATDGAGANMRAAPSMSAPIITTVREGTPVEAVGDPVAAEGRSWRRIRNGGRDGWVVAVVVRQR